MAQIRIIVVCLAFAFLGQATPAAFAQHAQPATNPTLSPAPAQSIVPLASSNAENQAWQVLSEGVASPKSSRRINAISALATIPGNERAVRMIAACLKDRDSRVRAVAAKQLGEMNAASAIPDLKNTLEDHSDEVNFAAALALAQLGDFTGRRLLLDVMNGKRKGGPGAFETERRALVDKIDTPAEAATFVVGNAAGPFLPGAGMGVRALGSVAKDHASPAKIAAVDMLASDDDPETARQLETALSNKNLLVRATAAKALGEQNNASSIPRLQQCLKDSHSAVRDMAAASIVKLSHADGAPTSQRAIR